MGIVTGAGRQESSNALWRAAGSAAVQQTEHHCDSFELGPDLELGQDRPDAIVDARQGNAAKLGDSGGPVAVDEQTQHLLLTGDELLHELTNSALLLRPNVCTFAVARATTGGAMGNVPASARNHLTATAWAVVLANTQFCHAHLLPTPIGHLTGSVTGLAAQLIRSRWLWVNRPHQGRSRPSSRSRVAPTRGHST